ncbi:MAG: hypothetical protein AMXMBFR55_21860 [Gemmatimonadota bacterium]
MIRLVVVHRDEQVLRTRPEGDARHDRRGKDGEEPRRATTRRWLSPGRGKARRAPGIAVLPRRKGWGRMGRATGESEE